MHTDLVGCAVPSFLWPGRCNIIAEEPVCIEVSVSRMVLDSPESFCVGEMEK
jgi:hypothetical protein